MIKISADLQLCEQLWMRLPGGDANLFDLWEVRRCFQESYGRRPRFMYAETPSGELIALLPLSEIEETGGAAFFPGETWHGKTWLEGNRIFARDRQVLSEILSEVPTPGNFRYLHAECLPPDFQEAEEDEVRYLFYPGRYGCSFDEYREAFPRKSLKRLDRETESLKEKGVSYRWNRWEDVDELLRLNLEAFGTESYFADPRFLGGFNRLVEWLRCREILRVTTVLIGGVVAAVDLGAVWRNRYTVMAGGTNPEFLGVAKLINFLHIEIACKERFESLDFLCGDFGWKQRFRLSGQQLYQIQAPADMGASASPANGTPDEPA
ncbi:MAG TPA: GNAT family N-acetyltransferase [bacterium]|nr:GNAT family N-acetyltransferase [bacterium]HPJ71125.1 GNAT family N-acetyltransferase [bacterium]HPQ66445.1 GNAT family N-acetyltransferase [bacterium]